MAKGGVKVQVGEQLMEGEPVDIMSTKDGPPTLLELTDGTQITLKTAVIDVLRIPGQWDKDRNPMYVVRSSQIMIVVSPDKLKGPKK